MCVYLRAHVDLCVCVYLKDVMLFTQVAVSARQSLSAAVNLWLIYPSPPLFLVDYNYCLCTSVFHGKKAGPCLMWRHPNVLSLMHNLQLLRLMKE